MTGITLYAQALLPAEVQLHVSFLPAYRTKQTILVMYIKHSADLQQNIKDSHDAAQMQAVEELVEWDYEILLMEISSEMNADKLEIQPQGIVSAA